MLEPALAVALLLPWAAGGAWWWLFEHYSGGTRSVARLRSVGLGFFIGQAILVFSLHLQQWLFSSVAPLPVAFMLLLMLLLPLLLLRRSSSTGGCHLHLPPPSVTTGSGARWLTPLLLLLISLHLLFELNEVVWRPLYPWDAWGTWMLRAKIWSYWGELVPFVAPDEWLQEAVPQAYTIPAYNYPDFSSLSALWVALNLGQWSEVWGNLPGYFAGLSVGVILYAEGRALRLSRPLALLISYLFFSVPIVGVHMSLGGYADIWVMGYSGVGLLLLQRGLVTGERLPLVAGLAFCAVGISVKNEGLVWFALALMLWLLVRGGWRIVLPGAVLLALLFASDGVDLPYLGRLEFTDGRLVLPLLGQFEFGFYDVSRQFWDNAVQFGNWNLLWPLLLTGLLVALLPPTSREKQVAAVLILLVISTLFFIFFLTDQWQWAARYTAINRLPLHFLPALIYALVLTAYAHRRDTANAVGERPQ